MRRRCWRLEIRKETKIDIYLEGDIITLDLKGNRNFTFSTSSPVMFSRWIVVFWFYDYSLVTCSVFYLVNLPHEMYRDRFKILQNKLEDVVMKLKVWRVSLPEVEVYTVVTILAGVQHQLPCTRSEGLLSQACRAVHSHLTLPPTSLIRFWMVPCWGDSRHQQSSRDWGDRGEDRQEIWEIR